MLGKCIDNLHQPDSDKLPITHPRISSLLPPLDSRNRSVKRHNKQNPSSECRINCSEQLQNPSRNCSKVDCSEQSKNPLRDSRVNYREQLPLELPLTLAKEPNGHNPFIGIHPLNDGHNDSASFQATVAKLLWKKDWMSPPP